MNREVENASVREGTSQGIHAVTTGPLRASARAILEQHGCKCLDQANGDCMTTFPPQTKCQEIWPRTLSERYRILLPDGLELRQVFDRFQEVSQLFIVLEKEPDKI